MIAYQMSQDTLVSELSSCSTINLREIGNVKFLIEFVGTAYYFVINVLDPAKEASASMINSEDVGKIGSKVEVKEVYHQRSVGPLNWKAMFVGSIDPEHGRDWIKWVNPGWLEIGKSILYVRDERVCFVQAVIRNIGVMHVH